MKVIDVIEKTEKNLTTDELVEQLVLHNRQVDLILKEKQRDEDGHVWDAENWVCVDGKRFVRSYFCDGRAASDFSGYNRYDLKGCFLPEEAAEVRLN